MESLCNRCGMCCKLIPVKCADKILVRDGFQIPTEEFENLLTPLTQAEARKINPNYYDKIKEVFPDARFYSCKALSEDNQCTLENMPEFCRNFPCSPLALIPDVCGYMGEVFVKNEELKKRIRSIKEEILDYETLISAGSKDSKAYKKIIDNLQRLVDKYSDFGSNDW